MPNRGHRVRVESILHVAAGLYSTRKAHDALAFRAERAPSAESGAASAPVQSSEHTPKKQLRPRKDSQLANSASVGFRSTCVFSTPAYDKREKEEGGGRERVKGFWVCVVYVWCIFRPAPFCMAPARRVQVHRFAYVSMS